METQFTPEESKEHFDFLDDLRESGITNMFGASSFLRDEFPELSRIEARDVLKSWMRGF
jgi:hypothetical protein